MKPPVVLKSVVKGQRQNLVNISLCVKEAGSAKGVRELAFGGIDAGFFGKYPRFIGDFAQTIERRLAVRKIFCVLLGLGAFLIGCGDADLISNEPETEFISSGGGFSNDQDGPGGRGSAAVDPCLGPRCERPNWQGREQIVDPLTDLGNTPPEIEHPSAGISVRLDVGPAGEGDRSH